jgi:hypothetical protein
LQSAVAFREDEDEDEDEDADKLLFPFGGFCVVSWREIQTMFSRPFR